MATLVVGGYGSVGRVICEELVDSADHAGSIRVAGRSRRRAEDLAARLGTGASSAAFDVADPGSFERALEDVDRVVVCVDQGGTGFVEACLERGIDYVDVTASDGFFRAVEALDDLATTAGATALLSVGLSPGLTNVLAADAAAGLDAVTSIHVGVLLGLGEAFGPAASRWTLERVGRPFEPEAPGGSGAVRGFTDPRTVTFPAFGRRTAYRFDLADQHVLARTLGVPEVATRLCFDSRAVTSLASALARSGTSPRLLEAVGVDRLVRWLEAVSFGTDEFSIVVEVSGAVGGRPRYLTGSIVGSEQSRATGLVAARTVEALAGGDLPAGVHHSHEVIDPGPLYDALRDRGYRLTPPRRAGTTGMGATADEAATGSP